MRMPQQTISWTSSFVSAFVGSFSHVGLDAIMHRDMSPLWPFARGNPLLGVISTGALHVLCMGLGALAALVLAYRTVVQNRSART